MLWRGPAKKRKEKESQRLRSIFRLLRLDYRCVWALSHAQLFATAWTVALQASLSMGFSRREYWSRLSFPPPGDLPDSGIKPESPAAPALEDWLFYCWAIREALSYWWGKSKDSNGDVPAKLQWGKQRQTGEPRHSEVVKRESGRDAGCARVNVM